MFPASFDESNTVLSKPDGMTADQCGALAVYRGHDSDGLPIVVSCWKPTAEELAEINSTGRVWLICWGESMPPAAIQGRTPFRTPPPTDIPPPSIHPDEPSPN